MYMYILMILLFDTSAIKNTFQYVEITSVISPLLKKENFLPRKSYVKIPTNDAYELSKISIMKIHQPA